MSKVIKPPNKKPQPSLAKEPVKVPDDGESGDMFIQVVGKDEDGWPILDDYAVQKGKQ